MLSLEVDISLLYQMVVFVILVFVMNRLIYIPLSKVMADRKRRIDQATGSAASIESEIENMLNDYYSKVADAKQVGNAERTKMKQEAAEREAAIIEAARLNAQKAMEKAKTSIEKETKTALSGLKKMKEKIGKEIRLLKTFFI